MRIVVVGGNSRDIGKTSVMAGLIRALPQYGWTAVKLTQYGHGVCSEDGDPCGCAPEEHPFAISEERDRSGASDTSRFLAAGARRALWVRVRQGALETALPALRQALGEDQYVILESNSILGFLQPDLYLTVLDPLTKDFKPSARQYLHRADACLILEPGLEKNCWEGVPVAAFAGKSVFSVSSGSYLTPEITAFVDSRLQIGTPSPAGR